MKKMGAAGILLAALVLCSPAAAQDAAHDEENNDAAVALLAGAGVTFASLTTGGIMITRGEHEFVKNGGLLGAQSGMILAPFVAHAVVGEVKRGIWFSLPLFVPIISNSIFTGLFPSIIKRAPAGVQYATWTGATLSILGGTLGVLDAVRVNERRPKTHGSGATTSSLSLVPIFGDGTTGAVLSGSL